jgi:hypothetical protein
MLKRHKDLLRAIVGPLRTTLAGTAQADGAWVRGDLDRELERLGIAPDGTLTPVDALPNAGAAERRARYAAEAAIATAVNGVKGAEAERRRDDARNEVSERAAYTWINRLLALRAMEARGLIDETLRNNPEYDGVSEALFILRSDAPARTAGTDGGWWAVLEDACTVQAEALPGLFDLGDPAAALRPSTAALLRCVALVGTAPNGYTLEEADAAFADPDAIGWAYQFYQEAAKARVYAKLGSGGKAASRAEIAAATQLFTEPYMVQWLLQNSLGRSYHEAYPDSKLPETWAYYIRNAELRIENAENRADSAILNSSFSILHSLTLIDPCCGSGHFLREAFDMFAAMYRERHPELNAAEIADRILTRHLHGIDLDPRAAQLTALTLYLRAWEYVKEEGKRQKAKGLTPVVYRPASLNIATTPSIAFNERSGGNSKLRPQTSSLLARHLRRHPEDRVMKPLLEGVFAALEQADILGSLLRPAEHIDAAIKALQQPHTIQMDFDADDAALRRTITALANSDPAELKRMLLDRVAQSFHAEAGAADDVAAQLFGREAEGGVRLLQLLDRKYAVVVTNPPYMGSANMDVSLKKYVERHYKPGKRDLYASFILRCLELCRANGCVAMVTMQSWMFLSSYSEFRLGATSEAEDSFTGIFSSAKLQALAHLGSRAFDPDNKFHDGVAVSLFVLINDRPVANYHIYATRVVGFYGPEEKSRALHRAVHNRENVYSPKQEVFRSINGGVMAYWLSESLLASFGTSANFGSLLTIKGGLSTTDNDRFVRYNWEAPSFFRWPNYTKGGGYNRWFGNNYYCVDWGLDGARMKSYIMTIPGNTHWSRRIFNTEYYFQTGYTYSPVGNGTLAVRRIDNQFVLGHKGPGVFVNSLDVPMDVVGIYNARIISYLLRSIAPQVGFEVNHLLSMPIGDIRKHFQTISNISFICSQVKQWLISHGFLIDSSYVYSAIDDKAFPIRAILEACLCSLEAALEIVALRVFTIDDITTAKVLSETGIPAGFHPLLTGYDTLPDLPTDLDLPPLPQEVVDYLAAHQRIAPSLAELQHIKARLRVLYKAGPGATTDDGPPTTGDEAVDDGQGAADDEEAVSGAHIPIPTETFLEELSVKMQLHPISVYWLLEELRREGARCKPEEQRLLEDRLSVIVLRLLGHRWPKQIEAGEPMPSWADRDGIIPVSGGAGEQTLAERLRGRLRAEDGDLGAQRVEALLSELTGYTLEDWLRREFFKRHVRQFKYRPIAWHLASDPSVAVADAKAGRGGTSVSARRLGGRRQPAFECMVYYHACGGDVLARVRTQYVEPLLRGARQQLEHANRAKDENGVVQATIRIQELEEFNRRLQQLAERGFASTELDKALADEPLDRWSGDGYLAPTGRDELLRQEQGWRVDLNDGVRVNIAPVQLAGLLISDVLKAVDARKAIADRARWRSDERRWVRAGKLPRCGWMGDDVPESAEWTRLAPQREAERMKLEEKRRTVMARNETPA